MGEVEDARGVRAVEVHEALQPHGPILHGPHRLGRFHSAPVDFAQRLRREGRRIGQARAVRDVLGSAPCPDRLGGQGQGLANTQQLDLHPFAAAQQHHRPIRAEYQPLRGDGRAGRVACQRRHFCLRPRHRRGAYGFGLSAHRGR